MNAKLLKTIKRRDNDEIRMTWTECESHPYLNISYWRKDASGKWSVRGEKTTSVRIRELDEYAAGVALAQKEALAVVQGISPSEGAHDG